MELNLVFSCDKVPFSFGTAVTIRMGVTLPISVRRTQTIALATTAFSTIAFSLVSIVLFHWSDWIIAIFTTDDEVKGLAHGIWLKVCLYNFTIALYDVLWGIATGLGKQWSLGIINFAFLWILGLPTIYFTAILLGGSLDAVWTWINALYLGMNICLIILLVFVDWEIIQEKIVDRDNLVADPSTELEKVADELTQLL
jgi:multidrug resistance protein, MATE family